MNRQQWRDPQFQNFVTVFRGFAYVGTVLEPYTKAGLKRAHQKAYKAAAGHPSCSQQCSRLHGQATVKWCGACKTWMNMLIHNRRGPPFRNWENTESWNWGTDYETIAAVYLPPSWGQTELKLNDFGTACHLWSTCKEFNIRVPPLKKLSGLRNKLYGHNPDMKINDVEKTKVFDALKCLLRESDVQAFINVAQCSLELDNIAGGDELQHFREYVREQIDQLNKSVSSMFTTEKLNTLCLKKIECDLAALTNEVRSGKSFLLLVFLTTIGIWTTYQRQKHSEKWLLLLVFLITMGLWTPYQRQNHQDGNIWLKQQNECLSEQYSYPFPQDLPLFPYMKEHSMLRGRRWLFDEIWKSVGNTSSTGKGVWITADMGYGKSAIVKHMLCAGKCDEAFKLRAHIIAFHLCKFDVPSTKDPQRFLYRLVGFLSTTFPEFGGIISMMPKSALLYDSEKCRKELLACFDQGILHPLSEIGYTEDDNKLIVIDALDECYDKLSNDNEIYKLLIARYKQLPKWIKFIITSRNISKVSNIKYFTRLHLFPNDKRNIADIKQYVESKASLHPIVLNVDGGLDGLIRGSEGNFLFIVHLIQYMTTRNEGAITTLPETLADIYEMNVERSFHSRNDYKVAKAIFEVVITSLHPLKKDELVNILESTAISGRESTELVLDKMKFCFRSSQEVTLLHMSIQAWLLFEDTLFRVSEEQGHSVLSRYLLSQINHSRIDITDLAIHVDNSNDPELVKVFLASYSSENVPSSTLHKLIWKSDSDTALKLILDFYIDVDTLNEGNVTAAFVAAARGHLNQLKVLLSRGANLNFKVNDSYLITTSGQFDAIKHDYYLGYGLIHIAAQFGHLNVVKFLIEQNETMKNSKNSLRHSAIEIACENGYLNIFNFLINSKSDVDDCLFCAANNGHTNIINSLITFQRNSTCTSQSESLTSIHLTKSVFTIHVGPNELRVLSCADIRGYNSFHNALVGGNIRTAIILFNIGVTIINTKVQIKDVPWMILLARKKPFVIFGDECADQLSCMDHLLQKILIKYTREIVYSDICQTNYTSLSLVHLVAVSGLQDSMKYLHESFGGHMVKCQNRDLIKPMYLWNLFNNKTAKETFGLTAKRMLTPDTEEVLLFWILEDFPFEISNGISGCLINENFYTKHKIIKCITRSTPAERYTVSILKRLINVELDFAMTLRYEQVNMQNIFQVVAGFKAHYEPYFRYLWVPFYYNRLREVLNMTFNVNKCKYNRHMPVPLPCFQLYKELNHVSNKFIELIKSVVIYAHNGNMQTSIKTFPEQFHSMRVKMKKIKAATIHLFESSTLEDMHRVAETARRQSWIASRHRYLNILKKTVRYQYIRDYIQPSSFNPIRIPSNLKKPFEDIYKDLNATSYAHI